MASFYSRSSVQLIIQFLREAADQNSTHRPPGARERTHRALPDSLAIGDAYHLDFVATPNRPQQKLHRQSRTLSVVVKILDQSFPIRAHPTVKVAHAPKEHC